MWVGFTPAAWGKRGGSQGHTGQAGSQALEQDGPHSRVSPSLLRGQNLFDSIKSEPFSIPEDDGNDLTHTFFNPDREGWLLKLGEARTRAPRAHA